MTPAPPNRFAHRVVRMAATLAVVGALAYALSRAVPQLRHPLFVVSLMREGPPEATPVPVAGVRPQALRDSWGAPRSGGRRHEGIDIFAPRGRPVVSATRGLVASVGENRLGGRVVWVVGPGLERHYYAHLDRYGRFEAGDRVQAGDTLGFVGTSGNARGTPPHLHYGIYGAGGALNPYPRLVPGRRGR